MSKPIDGDRVYIHYTVWLEDGTVFDSNIDGSPLEFTLGAGQVLPGFETVVRTLEIDESIKTMLPPEQAYGTYQDDMIIALNRAHFPAEAEPEIGTEVYLQAGNQALPARILEIIEDAIMLDANHSLAGKALIFNIERVGTWQDDNYVKVS